MRARISLESVMEVFAFILLIYYHNRPVFLPGQLAIGF
jgi:hypothetical protein